jgi:hypothetical protein
METMSIGCVGTLAIHELEALTSHVGHCLIAMGNGATTRAKTGTSTKRKDNAYDNNDEYHRSLLNGLRSPETILPQQLRGFRDVF